MFLERIRAKKWHKGSFWAVTFQVAFPTDQSAREALETLPKRKLHGFEFKTVELNKADEKPVGVYLAVDARGLPHTDTELMTALIDEGGLLPQYVLSYGWNLRATEEGNISSRGNLTLDVYLDPVIRTDHNHGSTLSRDLPLAEGKDKPDVVPMVKIQQPPAAMEIQMPDSSGVVFKRFRLVGCCKHCLGPPHLRQKKQRSVKCIYDGFCRICLAQLDALPNAGRGHVCTQGVPFKKPGYDPNMPEGESPMQTPDAVARMKLLQAKIAESNRIIAAAQAQDDNPRPRKAAKSSSQVPALILCSYLSAARYRVSDRSNLYTPLCLGSLSWTYGVVYRIQSVLLSARPALKPVCLVTPVTLSRPHDTVLCGTALCLSVSFVVENKRDCTRLWPLNPALSCDPDVCGALWLNCQACSGHGEIPSTVANLAQPLRPLQSSATSTVLTAHSALTALTALTARTALTALTALTAPTVLTAPTAHTAPTASHWRDTKRLRNRQLRPNAECKTSSWWHCPQPTGTGGTVSAASHWRDTERLQNG